MSSIPCRAGRSPKFAAVLQPPIKKLPTVQSIEDYLYRVEKPSAPACRSPAKSLSQRDSRGRDNRDVERVIFDLRHIHRHKTQKKDTPKCLLCVPHRCRCYSALLYLSFLRLSSAARRAPARPHSRAPARQPARTARTAHSRPAPKDKVHPVTFAIQTAYGVNA